MFKFFFVAAALIVCVVAESEDHHAEILKEKTEFGKDGWYSEFETSNHIRQLAHGDKHKVVGEFEWVDPHGEHAAIKYVADENGYQPEGEIIPTPHPIPEYILKAIEYNIAHPYTEEEDHHHHH